MLIQTRTSYLADECIAHALGVKADDFEAAIQEARRNRRESRMAELLADTERQLQRHREAHRRQLKARTSEDLEAAIADQLTAQARLERAHVGILAERARAGFTALDTEQEQAEAEREAEHQEFLRQCRKVARQTLVYGVPYLLALGLFFAAMRKFGLI